MLSELCVRRPVFATMLVMSLVVLGIFSFRDLGVDLFPKADPATVNVVAARCRARAPTRWRRRSSSRWRRRSAASPASTRCRRRASPRAGRRSPSGSCSSATSTTRPTTSARRWRARCRSVPPAAAAAGHHEGRSGRRSGHVARRLVRRDEPAHADRDRRQAGQARASRRSTASARSASSGGRAREIHIVVDIEKLNALRAVDRRRCATRSSDENVEIPGGTRRAGQVASCCCARSAASTRPRTSTTSSSRPRTARRSASPTSATPRTRSERPTQRRRGWTATPAVHARHPARDGREHDRGHRGRQGEARRRSGRRCRRR